MFTQTDNLCSKLIEELLKRLKTIEEGLKKAVPTKNADEILYRQKKEFFVMKKSLINTIKTTVEDMKMDVQIKSSQRKSEPPIKHKIAKRQSRGKENININNVSDNKRSLKTQKRSITPIVKEKYIGNIIIENKFQKVKTMI